MWPKWIVILMYLLHSWKTFNIERRSFWNHENVAQNRMENSELKETEETFNNGNWSESLWGLNDLQL